MELGMTDDDRLNVLIRHTSGSKANFIEQFPVDGRETIRFGRDPASDVVFDSTRDDLVSRTHAVIRLGSEASPGFVLEDLSSRNGTFLNKKKIEGKTEILPDDIVTLGLNGPSFIFDLSPRPANLVARTKVIEIAPVAATRLVGASSTAFDVKASPGADTTSSTRPFGAPGGKETIGRDTLLHEIGAVKAEAEQERKSSNRKWFAALAAVAVLAGVGGGFLIWRQNQERKVQDEAIHVAQAEVARVQQDAEIQQKETIDSLHRQLGTSSLDIVRQFGGATARINVRWRIYDKETGKEIFQKTVEQKNGDWHRLFWRNSQGKVLPVLTLDDQNHRNVPIGDEVGGTAFGVAEQGFLLTNRHLAAAWKTPWRGDFADGEKVVLRDCQNKNKRGKCPDILTTIDDSRLAEVKEWVPETGSPLYDAKNLSYIDGLVSNNASTRQGNFYGRNESLQITFANTRLAMNAALVRVSDENDVALIKVDTPSAIAIVKTANHADPSSGEKVVVLGYPEIALKTFAATQSFVDQQLKNNVTEVPQPYVTEGIVATVPTNRNGNKDGVVTFGREGDTFQLTINSTGPGNSGGPVFNSNGEVIGIFARAYKSGFGSSSGAVPIRSGLELMR
jgi:hypothetical protein